MKKNWTPALLAICLLAYSCGQKKTENKHFFPVISFIKSQVAHVDTSLYSIIRLDIVDSLRSDTSYIPREQFRNLTKDFLELPDLTESTYQDLYTEDTVVDEAIGQLVFVYRPVDPEKVYIKRQQVVISSMGDRVKSFFIETDKTNKDSSVQKKMLWSVDRSFQVVTTSQKIGEPEKTSIMKVIWNDEDAQLFSTGDTLQVNPEKNAHPEK